MSGKADYIAMSTLDRRGNQEGELRLTAEKGDDGWVLEVSGEIDLANVDEFRAAAHLLMAHAGPLVIDLAGLRFIDSSGIHALCVVRANAIEIGTSLTITRPYGAALRPFVVSGLEDHLFGVAEPRSATDGQHDT
jgi:anti-sigma B factor antagonist